MKNIETELERANELLSILMGELFKMRDRFYWDSDRENEINEVLYEEYKELTRICDDHLDPVLLTVGALSNTLRKQEE